MGVIGGYGQILLPSSPDKEFYIFSLHEKKHTQIYFFKCKPQSDCFKIDMNLKNSSSATWEIAAFLRSSRISYFSSHLKGQVRECQVMTYPGIFPLEYVLSTGGLANLVVSTNAGDNGNF